MANASRPNRPKQQRLNPAKRGTSGNPGKRGKVAHSGNPAAVAPAGARDWVSGARLRTLPLSIAPVAVGTGAAVVSNGAGEWHPVRAVLCLVLALCLQIGVNYANDYSDGVRGTDAHRVGPSRLTGSGRARPKQVLAVALSFFALAALAGLALVVITQQWWLIAVGAVAILAAWFYTGGKRPYGYAGLGELFVFVFFGLIATCGTTFVQVNGADVMTLFDSVNVESWLGGIAIGLLACAVLMVNNIRDIAPDKAAGKRTLAVLIGDMPARIVFVVLLVVPYLILWFFGLVYPLVPFVFFTLLLAAPAALIAVMAKTPKELVLALQLTSFTALFFGLGLGAAFAF